MGTTKGLRGEQKLEGGDGAGGGCGWWLLQPLGGPLCAHMGAPGSSPSAGEDVEPTALGHHGLGFNLLQSTGMVLKFGNFTESFP